MQLRLKYAPVPENAARFTGEIAASAAQVSGVQLDYTPDSLTLVDTIFDDFRAEGITGEQLAETSSASVATSARCWPGTPAGDGARRRKMNKPSSGGP